MTALAAAVLVASTLGGVQAAPSCPAEVYEYAWPVDQACSVSWCESRWLPDAIGGSNYGLFQVNAVHRGRVGGDVLRLLEPATNVRIAYDLWRAEGWGPWSCKP